LKKIGWKGFIAGQDSGIYRVGPLARLNVCEGLTTPLAQKEYEKFYTTLGGKPVHQTLAYHWARLIELLYAAEKVVQLSADAELLGSELRNPIGEPGEGVGVIEACRGTLIHHYTVNSDRLIDKANMIVSTTHNKAPINLSIRSAAKGLIKAGHVDDGILNMVEMAFRAYDPCFGCATHAIDGGVPIEIRVYDHQSNMVYKRRNY
jgi:F420-non-reducing hydrogenase large subunit